MRHDERSGDDEEVVERDLIRDWSSRIRAEEVGAGLDEVVRLCALWGIRCTRSSWLSTRRI
jgi:hypothetical protein